MKNIQKTLKVGGVICLIAALLPLRTIISEIYIVDEYSLYYLISSSLEIVLSLITSIVYFIFARKDNEKIIERRNLFVILMILNIFNNLIVWVVAFWMEISVTQLSKIKFYSNVRYHDTETNQDTIVIEPSDYEITTKIDILADELKRLETMYHKGDLTKEEYERLRQKLLDKFS